MKNAKEEYAMLANEKKEELIRELEKVKVMKAKGFHSSAKSRINDATKTVAVLENEVGIAI